MITKDTLPQLLTLLGFDLQGVTYSRIINGAQLEVNLKQETLSYPEAQGLIINERQTCNFSANENFVVLECVCRLLEKGYKPQHIELEPKWKLGRGASGGRADILVKDNKGKPLLIIECKTAGSEFKKAWGKTLQDGDQLFSYAQQISETQFLCLYASDLDNGALVYQSHIIAHRDNDKYLDDNPDFKAFRLVTDVRERYVVWRDTYKLNFTTKGIFEDNIQPYHIGKDKYSLADLQPISATDQQKKYHEFATILRQHNVSGRENAFDKLVNLFLCKLVDETENPHELKFYWKGVAYDTHFDLLDRLQQLYQAGMGKFLGESITYIDQATVRNAMRFIRQNPDATQKAVWHLFLQQKFFTNNDFSFIDVHNEKLFYQNAEVLLKILQMWQDIRLTNPSGHNQFLGDMFEGFLDQGVKQSEGQYFTPMPICRFILMSLPLESLIKNSNTPPKAIDYACGAGHFLNELALQLKPLVAQHKQAATSDYHKTIFGIEKEYRLSKVAKVSAFMYGQQDINICYGDALVNQHNTFPAIQNGSFDLLVANPPYSVRGFLETLPEEERNNYRLSETIGDLATANSIETFFIERAKQLLKSGGVAALILPSSILSNGGNTYVRTREILLQYFDIVAIAEFGSGTFGKTGTNTVTLFLRRKPTQPDTAEHYRERVEEWFKGCGNSKRKQIIYKDEHLIVQYAAHICVALDDYKALLRGEPSDALMAHETFAQYLKTFEYSSEILNLKKSKGFKVKTHNEQQAELGRRFMEYVQTIERDKLYHYVMAADQPNPVLVIRSPGDTKAQKQFLGYDWSSAKGDEGIKLTKDVQGHHLTPLYDETNRNNVDKLNCLIAATFATVRPEPVEGQHASAHGSTSSPRTEVVIPPALRDYANSLWLVDMLNFSRVTFEKQFALSVRKNVQASAKWPLKSLVQIADVKKGTSITEKKSVLGNVKVVAGGMSFAYLHNVPNRAANNITISASGASAGYVNFWREEIFASDCTTVRGVTDEHTLFLFHLLQSRQAELYALARGAAQPHVYPADLESVQIPEVDPAIQTSIVTECEAVDAGTAAAQANIAAARTSLRQTLSTIPADQQTLERVAHKVSDTIDPQAQEGIAFYVGLENIESGTGRLVGETATPYHEIKSAKIRYQNGDVLYGKLRPNLNKVYLAQQAGICSTDILVFRFDSPTQARFYAAYFLTELFNAEVLKSVSGQQLPRTSWNNMQTIKVPALTDTELEKLVAVIEALERTITAAQALIEAAPAKKQTIMHRYL